jgi:threonine synthase
MAAYAKLAEISCDIYLPSGTSESKITQISAYGSHIKRVIGDRKDTAFQAFEAAKNSYYASHCFNPYFFQGTKTFAYEVCEQMNWQAPQSLVLPAGNGTLILGCYIGFKELANMGIITKIPQIIAVQSQKCQPLNLALSDFSFNKENYLPEETIAEGIAIPNPVRLKQMAEIIHETNGQVITVSEDEITHAWKYVANLGFYIEPTSAATIAGVLKFKNQNDEDKNIVSLFSGNGLKSTEKIAKIIKAEHL